MARWPKLTVREKGRLRAEAFAQVRTVAGTILPADQPLVDRGEMVAEAEAGGLATSRAYAAVNTMQAQPFMLNIDGQPVTMVSSAHQWLEVGRHELAHEHRDSLRDAFAAAGSLPPKEGNRPRGRPRKVRP